MAHPRRFRFGVQLAQAASAKEWADAARRAEDLGYSTLFVPDHFDDQLAPLPALMAAADATTELRVGALVFDNDYKHPVVLAKEAATLDVLSGGRTEFGLGAGWMRTDYEASGIPYDEPSVRVDRMEEGLAVIKGLFADGPVDFAGEHYTINGLDGTPKPIQRPGPPILIGGGRPRVLSIAAREADIVGINPNLSAGEVTAETAKDASPEATDRKVGWVREAAGHRFDELELSMLIFVASVTDDRRAFAELLAGGFGVDPEDALDIPHALFGSVDEICDGLERTRERWGVSYPVVQGLDAMEQMAPVVSRLSGA
jgi:probable F420-dependent oxidoreductase